MNLSVRGVKRNLRRGKLIGKSGGLREMISKAKRKNLISKAVLYVVLILGAVIFVFPVFWMLITALKTRAEVITYPIQWLPKVPRWENFVEAVKSFPIVRLTGNTLFLAAVNVIGTLLSCTMVAYAFSRLQWPGRDTWFMVLLATMMMPGVCTMIPQFIMYKNFGWIDTYLPLTIPSFTASAGNVFLIRQFFRTIPNDLSEGARIDGAGHLRIYSQIVMPLCRPVVIMIGINTFMWTWNDFQGPLLYLNDANLYTITYGLRTFQSKNSTDWSLLMAAALLISVPTIALFLSCQKYFIEGIVMSGLKE